MKMDFPHLTASSPFDRAKARFVTLVASASNGPISGAGRLAAQEMQHQTVNRFGGLEARIAFFGSKSEKGKDMIFGAFLPDREKSGSNEGKCKNGVNLSSSMIGKPSFLGSCYPGSSGNLRGMEN